MRQCYPWLCLAFTLFSCSVQVTYGLQKIFLQENQESFVPPKYCRRFSKLPKEDREKLLSAFKHKRKRPIRAGVSVMIGLHAPYLGRSYLGGVVIALIFLLWAVYCGHYFLVGKADGGDGKQEVKNMLSIFILLVVCWAIEWLSIGSSVREVNEKLFERELIKMEASQQTKEPSL